MIDFNKMIEEQISKAKKDEKEKVFAIDLIDEHTATDEEKEANKKMEELYYKFFVDTTLVKIIENQIKNITCEDDINRNFEVSIYFQLFSEIFDLYNNKNKNVSSIVSMSISKPNIGRTIDVNWDEISDRDMYLIYNILPKWIILHNHLYFDNWNLLGKNDSIVHDDEMDNVYIEKYLNLSFTINLQRLIDMYYAEKQREEKKEKINNQSNKHKK